MTTVKVFAPAKINLTLHVTGQRDDGYHLLDSLVSFGPAGDFLTLARAESWSLTIDGPEAAALPSDMNNLAIKAARLASDRPARLGLSKHLPVASGIGGGSADAAAAYRGMLYLDEDQALPALDDTEWLTNTAGRLTELGADVPMCFGCIPMRVRGIGDRLDIVNIPPVPALLVNPRRPVSTPDVFRALEQKNNPPMPTALPDFCGPAELIDWLRLQRNDLEIPACRVEPAISETLDYLRALPHVGLARMSGSGATCFALFEDEKSAIAAGEHLVEDHPEWWLAGGWIGDRFEAALPRIS